ncbi:MAG: hypothetical protein ACI8RZ_002953 [Myxococcota bacterium]|jgi:hypothetical protein
MSIAAAHTIVCPTCQAQFSGELLRSLHVTRRPDARAAILAGTFQRFTCPECGGAVRVEPTLLYTDFERHHWFAVFPRHTLPHRHDLIDLVDEGFEANMRTHCPPMVRQWAPRFVRRVIFGLPALREKLLCDLHALDDRVLEVAKMQLLRDTAPRAFHPATLLYLDAVTEAGLELVLAERPGEDGTQIVRRIGVKRAFYERIAAWPALPGRFPELYQPWLADWQAALQPHAPLPQAQTIPTWRAAL